jgi:hypothetical protein
MVIFGFVNGEDLIVFLRPISKDDDDDDGKKMKINMIIANRIIANLVIGHHVQ